MAGQGVREQENLYAQLLPTDSYGGLQYPLCAVKYIN